MIKHIFHTADWHIRQYQRHDEFKFSFKDLHNQITNNSFQYNEAVICILGDIFEHKEYQSAESNLIFIECLQKLLLLHPVILTIGNHDLPNSGALLDHLTPIVKALGNKNLHYLKESCIFVADNVQFVHYSFLDGEKPTINPDLFTVGLYHGPVYGLKNPINPMSESKINKHALSSNFFAGCDVVLMGDIHIAQTIKHPEYDLHYCGSLYQQNIGEPINGHCLGIYNVDKKSYKKHEIEQKKTQLKIKIKSKQDIINNFEIIINKI